MSEERDGGGVWSARGHVKEEEGGLATARDRAGDPEHERVRSGGGSLGTAAPGRAPPSRAMELCSPISALG
jgi:hypothetical protein